MSIKVHGWDVSLNHAGIVELTDGVLTNFWFVSDKRNFEKTLKDHFWGIQLKNLKKSCDDWQLFSLYRLLIWKNTLTSVLKLTCPDYIAIEDYALGNVRRAHYLGELGGIARIVCFELKIPLRMYDPLSIKMFVTGHGNADKCMVGKTVQQKWGIDFFQYNPKSKKPNTEVSEDLYDAYSIAQLLWTEIQLRRGSIRLNSLDEKRIRVFNRTTKLYPTNILGREWLKNTSKGALDE